MNSEAMRLVAADSAAGSPDLAPRTPLYPTPVNLATSLRVVMVVPRLIPTWFLRFFDLVRENPWLDLAVVPVGDANAPVAAAVSADVRALLEYERRRPTTACLAPVTVSSHPDVVFGSPLGIDLDIAAVRASVGALRPDLILLFGVPQWAEALGDRALRGCWDFDASLTDANHAAHALLEPVMRGEVATAAELELHHLGGPPTTLASSWGSTCRASASVQREQVFRKIPALLMRSLRRLANGELHVPPQRTARLQLSGGRKPMGFGAGLRAFVSTLAFRFATRQRRSQPREQPWQLVVRHGPGLLDPGLPDMPRHTILASPDNRFWADPCVAEEAGRRFVFVEQWAATDIKGVIACLELLPDSQVLPLGVILDRPFHLSFPQPFQWKDQWYLTVESGQCRRVSLYRADEFPLGWRRVTDLITGWTCVDPTLHRHGDHWYLFANVAESGGSTWDELFLFVADSPLGPFRPHPANPIVSDARRARPAGRLFRRDGRLFRPAQDCAPSYGTAVVFNEVLELSPTHYRETPLGRLDARWTSGLDGCHTYSEGAGVEVLDARGTPPEDSPRMIVVEVAHGPAAGDRPCNRPDPGRAEIGFV